MSHFAHIDKNNIVTDVIVIEQETLNTGAWGDPAEWVQTSYNTYAGIHYGADGQPDGGIALRKNYAGIGYTYDPIRDAFIPPKPCIGWVLNEDTCHWEAPFPVPDDGKQYRWDNVACNWAEILQTP